MGSGETIMIYLNLLRSRTLKLQIVRVVSIAVIASQCACAQQKPAPQAATPASSAQPAAAMSVGSISTIPLPSSLSIFGERIPLENSEIRERAEREFYLNLQQPAQILLNIKRSGRYFELFEKILKEHGAPDDLKYLAVAESALYMSRSAKDAVGIWQFVEGTARRYGLEVNEYVDERRHVEKSTHAAVEFLKDSYTRFGSWTMAAAAYNMGPEGAQFNVDVQGSSNYFELYFNEETSRYVFRIAIMKELLEHAQTYGFNIPMSERYGYDRTRKVKEYKPIENLAHWAAQHHMSYKELKLLNPWMLKTSLPKPKNGFWEILVKD